MKTYKFLKTAQGARDGITVETFNRGEVYELDEAFGDQFVAQALAELTDEAVGGHLTDEPQPAPNPADARETKVERPAESKDGEAGVDLETQNVEELVALARDTYGLDVDSTMDEDDLRALIEDAEAAASGSEGLSTANIGGKKPKKK